MGTRALFYSGLLTIVTNTLAPFVVQGAAKGHTNGHGEAHRNGDYEAVVHEGMGVDAGAAAGQHRTGHWEVKKKPLLDRVGMALGMGTGWGRTLKLPKIQLASLWATSHLVFAACMVGTL
jgi:hypothetical protein